MKIIIPFGNIKTASFDDEKRAHFLEVAEDILRLVKSETGYLGIVVDDEIKRTQSSKQTDLEWGETIQ